MNFSISLPRPFRTREILAFHGRDVEGIAEQVIGSHIRKAFLLEEIPVELSIKLGKRAECAALFDRPFPDGEKHVREVAKRMLGLTLDPDPFEKAVRGDSLLGAVVARQSGLRIPQTATPFEALTWAIIGQQINLAFAITLRRTFIQTAGRPHSSGLWCYPDAASVARIEPETLGRLKFSWAKAETLVRLARVIESGELCLENLHEPEEIERALIGIKGIGPWTIHYAMLRGFACADCSLHGDAGVRGAVHRLAGGSKLDGLRLQGLLERYKPFRSLAAAHLWASAY